VSGCLGLRSPSREVRRGPQVGLFGLAICWIREAIYRQSTEGSVVDRRDSSLWRNRELANAEIWRGLRSRAEFELLFEDGNATSERLRIWRVHSQGSGEAERPGHDDGADATES
jgi:hypothetical protein